MAKTVLIPVSSNMGYAPDQIDTPVTLGSLLEALQEAIENYGEDAKVVLSNGQRYGAGFGEFSSWGQGTIEISDANPDDEEDEYL